MRGTIQRLQSRGGLKKHEPRALLSLSVVVIAACTQAAADPEITVEITKPTEGSTVTGTAADIELGVNGIELAPAAEARPGTAHHHLYLDVDFPPPKPRFRWA